MDHVDNVYTLRYRQSTTRRHALRGIPFEWDPNKASANDRKHQVSFETACEIFFDPLVRPQGQDQQGNELRQAVVGLTAEWRLLFVVYLERGEALRIISARPATSEERRNYEDI